MRCDTPSHFILKSERWLICGLCTPFFIGILIAYFHYVELCINETAHTANSNVPLVGMQATGNGSILPSFERVECLWRSLNVVKSWFDMFFTLSLAACPDLSFLHWAQMARCLVVLIRLSTFEDAAWDHQAVRKTVDLLQVLDKMAKMLELASIEAGERSDIDQFMQMPKMIRFFRAVISAKMAPGEETAWPYGENGGAEDITNSTDMTMMMQSIDFGNDKWFEDFCAGFR